MNVTQQALTAAQKKQVEENLGLVATHIRRHVPDLSLPRRTREWDDLFQEGCLGLAAAATTFDPDDGVPFAAYALRRIQAAVSKALGKAFSTVRVPNKEQADARRAGGGEARVVSLDFDPPVRGRTDRQDPFAVADGETIGSRVRHKYEQAVRRAAGDAKSRLRRGRDDRLIERLTDERLLVPDEDFRRPLRQIARDTNSSFARVIHAEKRLIEQVGSELASDPEMATLRDQARRSVHGVETLVDETIDRRVASAVDDRFLALLESATPQCRGLILTDLLKRSRIDTLQLARRLFARLHDGDRKALFGRLESATDMIRRESTPSPR